MILSGHEIGREVEAGRIVIDPFQPAGLEPNSYGFHLGPRVISYADQVLDPNIQPTTRLHTFGPEGMIFEPGRLYLGSTAERLGSDHYAATLEANRSVSTLGVWIQYSAPLGHCGAIIPWTLELKVAQAVRLYPDMLIGKIAFWRQLGELAQYDGRYSDSTQVVASRIWTKPARQPALGVIS